MSDTNTSSKSLTSFDVDDASKPFDLSTTKYIAPKERIVDPTGTKEPFFGYADAVTEAQRKFYSDYKTWAKEDIKYDDFGDMTNAEKQARIRQNLNKYNTLQTMNDFFTALSPVMEKYYDEDAGIVETLVALKFSGLNDILERQSTENAKSNWLKTFLNVYNASDSETKEKFGLSNDDIERANKAIASGMSNDRLDSIAMTPKQLAILHMNFTEQCYVDMRKYEYDPNNPEKYNKNIETCMDNYNKAIKHIEAIATNSGVTMSQVDAEERKFVEAKIKDDPCYKNIFSETFSVYGASPVSEKNGPMGRFATPDGHNVYGDNDVGVIFTPRKPYTDKKETYQNDLLRQGEQMQWMINYLDSSECPCSDSVKREVKNMIEQRMQECKVTTINLLQHDFDMSKRSASEFFDKSFMQGVDNQKKSKIPIKDGAEINPMMVSSDEKSINDFYKELKYTVEKQIYEGVGVDISKAPRKDVMTARMAVLDKIDQSPTASSLKMADKSYDQFADDLVKSELKSMKATELYNMLMHAGTNMEQGYKERSSYSRYIDSRNTESVRNLIRNGHELNISPSVNDNSMTYGA